MFLIAWDKNKKYIGLDKIMQHPLHSDYKARWTVLIKRNHKREVRKNRKWCRAEAGLVVITSSLLCTQTSPSHHSGSWERRPWVWPGQTEQMVDWIDATPPGLAWWNSGPPAHPFWLITDSPRSKGKRILPWNGILSPGWARSVHFLIQRCEASRGIWHSDKTQINGFNFSPRPACTAKPSPADHSSLCR